jgi:23S rRNA (adenine2503-C2)-methyltransferase
MTTLLGKTEDELMEFAEGIGEARFRGKQIYRAIYGRRAPDVARMTDLSKDLREKLNSIARVAETRIIDVFYSTDGTRRYLLRLGDGREAEAVFMPEEPKSAATLSASVARWVAPSDAVSA